jgi:hypothetical protein
MALSGVRSSWLMLARNCDLCWLASTRWTVSELADFFLQAWDLLMVLDMNFGSDGRRADEVRAFFWGSSEFYPGFKALIAHRVEEWLKPQLAALAEEERDDE